MVIAMYSHRFDLQLCFSIVNSSVVLLFWVEFILGKKFSLVFDTFKLEKSKKSEKIQMKKIRIRKNSKNLKNFKKFKKCKKI